MKKIIIVLILCLLFVGAIVTHGVFALQNVKMGDSEYGKNMYTPAFPLIFEDLEEKIVKGKVEFVGFHSLMVDVLNSIESPKGRISDKFYYKIIAKKTPEYKKKIEKDIKEKFNETSSIIEEIEWEPADEDAIVLYSMVKKNVEFLKYYEVLDPMAFGESDQKFKYFGTKDKTEYFADQTQPLFYKDRNNYAISLKTKTNDEIIFYMTDDLEKKTVHKLWNDLNKKIKADNFKRDDRFLAPFLEIKEMISYEELVGKEIKGTDFRIAKALESVEFSLDNKGAKLKNEALMLLEKCALSIEENSRYFYFDRPFVLFIREEGRKNPYFMVKIQDDRYLVKP